MLTGIHIIINVDQKKVNITDKIILKGNFNKKAQWSFIFKPQSQPFS